MVYMSADFEHFYLILYNLYIVNENNRLKLYIAIKIKAKNNCLDSNNIMLKNNIFDNII